MKKIEVVTRNNPVTADVVQITADLTEQEHPDSVRPAWETIHVFLNKVYTIQISDRLYFTNNSLHHP